MTAGDYIWPDDLAPFAQEFFLEPHVGRSESPFTREQKTYELSAPRWRTRMQFRGGYDGTVAQGAFGPRLDAFIAKLNGGANSVAIYDYRRPALRGDNDAADLGNLAASAGASMMTITGADPGSIIARDGDYLGGDDRAHIIIGDVTADALGSGKARFKPPLVADIAEDEATFGKPVSYFKLTDDDAGSNATEVGGATQYDLTFVEDLNGPSIDYPTLIPTAANPMAAVRVADDRLLIRTRSSTIVGAGLNPFDEYGMRNPDGQSGVTDGWQLVDRSAYAFRRFFRFLVGPDDLGDAATAEFALRLGAYDAANVAPPYASGGEGPDYAYDGFGHGRMVWVSTSIVKDGGGPNLATPGNWDIGEELTGDQLLIETVFTLKLFNGTTTAATLTFTQAFDENGLREFGAISSIQPNIGFNDTYTAMMPLSPDAIDWFKPVGQPALRSVSDGTEKLGGVGWTTTTATVFQAWADESPTIVDTVTLGYGQPIRRTDAAITPWQLNTYGRVQVSDEADYPKLRVLAASSAEVPASRVAWPLVAGKTYEWLTIRRTKYLPGGAT